MRFPLVNALVAGILATLVAACASAPPRSGVSEYLEEATGTTVTYVATPAAFVNEQPGLASSGRDYVYVAPLKVSGGGKRTYWLWLGIWSTVDRQARTESTPPLRLGALQIVADGEPIDLDPQPASDVPAGIRRIPYATPVGPTEEFLVPVTRSQLARLARARDLSLDDRPAGGTFRVWRDDGGAAAVLAQFADE